MNNFQTLFQHKILNILIREKKQGCGVSALAFSCHRDTAEVPETQRRQNISIKVFYCNCSNSFMPMNHSSVEEETPAERFIKTTPACDWRERGRDCRGLPENSWSIRDTLEHPRWKNCAYLTPMQSETTLFFSSLGLNR